MRRIFDRLLGWLWSNDFFISYASDDGADYPKQLHAMLSKDYKVFLDSEGGFNVGDNLRFATRRRVINSTYLIVIGRHHALTQSTWVPREVEHYLERQGEKKSRRVPILIDFDNAVDKAQSHALPVADSQSLSAVLIERDDLTDWLHARENNETSPSEPVLQKIRDSFDAVRTETRRIRSLQITAVVLSVLLSLTILLTWLANSARQAAQNNLAQSYIANAESAMRDARYRQAATYASQALSIKDSRAARRILTENPFAQLASQFAVQDALASALAISPAGVIAVGDDTGRISVFNPSASPGEYWTFDPAIAAIEDLEFSPKGHRIIASDASGAVRLVNIAEGGRVRELHTVSDAGTEGRDVSDFLKSPQVGFLSEQLVVFVRVFEGTPTLEVTHIEDATSTTITMGSNIDSIAQIAVHPSQPLLAALLNSGEIYTIDVRSPGAPSAQRFLESLESTSALIAARATSITFSGNADFRWAERDTAWSIIVGTDDARILEYNQRGALVSVERFPQPPTGGPTDLVTSVSVDSENWRLIAMRADGTVMTRVRSTLKQSWELERLFDPDLDTKSFTDNHLLACCSRDDLAVTSGPKADTSGDVIQLWDLAARRHVWHVRLAGKYANANSSVSALDFDASGRFLVAGTDSSQTVVLDRQAKHPVAISPGVHWEQTVTSSQFSPGESRLQIAQASWGGTPRIWSLRSCSDEYVMPVQNEFEELYALDWTSDGKQLIVAPFTIADGTTLQLYPVITDSGNVATLSEKPSSEIHIADRLIDRVIAIPSSTTLLAYETATSTFFRWRPDESATKSYTARNQGDIDAIATSMDGTMVVVASSGVFEHWQATASGLEYQSTIPCEDASCFASNLVIDPDKVWFAYSAGNQVYAHRINDGQLLAELSPHDGQINALAVSPDGKAIASGSQDGSIAVWNIHALIAEPSEVRTIIESDSGIVLEGGELIARAADAVWHQQSPATVDKLLQERATVTFRLKDYQSDTRAHPECLTGIGVKANGKSSHGTTH